MPRTAIGVVMTLVVGLPIMFWMKESVWVELSVGLLISMVVHTWVNVVYLMDKEQP